MLTALIDVGGVETRGTTTFFVESMGSGGGDPAGLAGHLESINGRGEVTNQAVCVFVARGPGSAEFDTRGAIFRINPWTGAAHLCQVGHQGTGSKTKEGPNRSCGFGPSLPEVTCWRPRRGLHRR